MAALSPPERLLHDMQAAFDTADVPMSEYTNLDARGLGRLLPPLLVARLTRVLLEETRSQWTRRQDNSNNNKVTFVDATLISRKMHAPVAARKQDALARRSAADAPFSYGYLIINLPCVVKTLINLVLTIVANPSEILLRKITCVHAMLLSGYILCDIPSGGDTASEIFADRSPSRSSPRNAVGGGRDSPGSRGNVPGRSTPPATDPARHAVGEFRPTHVVYLDATADLIVAKREGESARGLDKEAEARIRAEVERYFAEEQTQPETDGSNSAAEMKRASTEQHEGEAPKCVVEGTGTGGDASSGERWMPATASALRDAYGAKTAAIKAEGDGVEALDQHLSGGKIPAFVWMLLGDGVVESEGAQDIATDAEGEENDRTAGATVMSVLASQVAVTNIYFYVGRRPMFGGLLE